MGLNFSIYLIINTISGLPPTTPHMIPAILQATDPRTPTPTSRIALPQFRSPPGNSTLRSPLSNPLRSALHSPLRTLFRSLLRSPLSTPPSLPCARAVTRGASRSWAFLKRLLRATWLTSPTRSRPRSERGRSTGVPPSTARRPSTSTRSSATPRRCTAWSSRTRPPSTSTRSRWPRRTWRTMWVRRRGRPRC